MLSLQIARAGCTSWSAEESNKEELINPSRTQVINYHRRDILDGVEVCDFVLLLFSVAVESRGARCWARIHIGRVG
jgi:hypothetical protein